MVDAGPLHWSAERRLAFRELGLSIGLRDAEALRGALESPDVTQERDRLTEAIEGLERHLPLAHTIEEFWLDPGNRKVDSWTEHRDISRVMLATSRAPGGYLGF